MSLSMSSLSLWMVVSSLTLGLVVLAEPEHGVSFGAFGGANLANLQATNNPDTPRTGLGLGVNAEFPVAPHFFLQPELGYLQKGEGTSFQTLNALGLSEETFHYDTIELSLLAKFKYGVSDMKLELFAGPTFGFAINRQATSTTTASPPVTSSQDLSSQLNSLDYGFEFGLGGEYKVVDGVAIYIEGRYLFGLANINNASSSGTNTAVYTRGIYGLFGLRFWLNQLL